jgi:hypothetical protein
MNKIALAFLTKDRVELSKRTIVPLGLAWCDDCDEAMK